MDNRTNTNKPPTDPVIISALFLATLSDSIKDILDENHFSSQKTQLDLDSVTHLIDSTLIAYLNLFAQIEKTPSGPEKNARIEITRKSALKDRDLIINYLNDLIVSRNLLFKNDLIQLKRNRELRHDPLLAHIDKMLTPPSEISPFRKNYLSYHTLNKFLKQAIKQIQFAFFDNFSDPYLYNHEFKTVHDFLKDNCDFFLAPYYDDNAFQAWALNNTNLLTPLSNKLHHHLYTPMDHLRFKLALTECQNSSNTTALIEFLKKSSMAYTLIPSLYKIIINDTGSKITQKWRSDKFSPNYNRAHKILLTCNIESEYFDDLRNFKNQFNDNSELSELFKDFYNVGDVFDSLEAAWNSMDNIDIDNITNNDALTLDNIFFLCEEMRRRFRLFHNMLIDNIDDCFTAAIKKHDGKIRNAIATAKIKLSVNPITLGNKLILKDFIKFFQKNFTSLSLIYNDYRNADKNLSSYPDRLNSLANIISKKSLLITNIDSLIEKEFEKARTVLFENQICLFLPAPKYTTTEPNTSPKIQRRKSA